MSDRHGTTRRKADRPLVAFSRRPRFAPNNYFAYALYSGADVLYVGVTTRLTEDRMTEHRRTKWWWPMVTHWEELDLCTNDRREAFRLEAEIITAMRPRFNITHNMSDEATR